MFIDLTTEKNEKTMVNLDNVDRVVAHESGHTFIVFTGRELILRVKESYKEVKLKMAGR